MPERLVLKFESRLTVLTSSDSLQDIGGYKNLARQIESNGPGLHRQLAG